MTHLANNIRFLRKQQGWTQTELADKLNVNRSAIGAYEEGRAEPRLSGLRELARLFGCGVEQLLERNLEKEGLSTDANLSGTSLRVLPVLVDQEGAERSTLVPVKASAGYLRGYGDAEYIGSLPHFNLPYPELPPERSYRVFQIRGDSMLPVPPGAYVIGEYVQDWRNLRTGTCYILVTRDEGVVYKRVENRLDKGELLLRSDNPEYTPYALPADQLLEAWRAVGFTSFELPDGYSEESVVDRLVREVADLRAEMGRIKRLLQP